MCQLGRKLQTCTQDERALISFGFSLSFFGRLFSQFQGEIQLRFGGTQLACAIQRTQTHSAAINKINGLSHSSSLSSFLGSVREGTVVSVVHRQCTDTLITLNRKWRSLEPHPDVLLCETVPTQNAVFCPGIPQTPGAPILQNLSIYPSVNLLLMWLWLNLSRYTYLWTGQET